MRIKSITIGRLGKLMDYHSDSAFIREYKSVKNDPALPDLWVDDGVVTSDTILNQTQAVIVVANTYPIYVDNLLDYFFGE